MFPSYGSNYYVSPIAFPPALIILIGSLIGDEHPIEEVDLIIGVSNIPYNEGGIAILVYPSALRYRYCGGSRGFLPAHAILKIKVDGF